jgi:hypothetical protein
VCVGFQIGHIIQRHYGQFFFVAREHRAQAQTPDATESVNRHSFGHISSSDAAAQPCR